MSFLDNLESSLKSMESREERESQTAREAKARAGRRAHSQAAAGYAEQLKKSPYAQELLRQATRIGHSMRTKVHLAWLGSTLRLEARASRLELRPTPEGVVAVFIENQADITTRPVDLNGSAEKLAREWLASLPPLPPPAPEPEFE